ncbi:MAG: transpeptidase family protein [Calditrichaeota bacterium]|nr:transpeptidase family protein [Calditrichota bacterium]
MPRLESPLHKGRFFILIGFLFGFWLILEANLFRFQVVNHDKLSAYARSQYESEIELDAQRGTIYDRSGNKLATNIIYYDIAADPQLIKNKQFVAKTLANSFPRSEQHYLNRMRNNGPRFRYLERKTQKSKVSPLLEIDDPGLIRVENFGRYYPYGSYAAQLLGFTDPDDHGLSGLELQYEDALAGVNGKAILQYDATRKVAFNADYPMLKPIPGSSLRLTIDKDIQTVVEKALQSGVDENKAKSGIAVVMDPFTGAVVAMANYPGFNPNTHKKYSEWVKKNRAVTDAFEPGSTLKMFSAAAILQERKHKPQDIVFCENGRYKIYDHYIKDTKPHAWLSFQKVIEKSSNIGMIKLIDNVPSPVLYRYLKNFGFGSETGIGLLGESEGFLAAPSSWSGLSRAEISIGQEIGVTAVQITSAFCSLINGGYLYKPFIVSQVFDVKKDNWETIGKPEKVRQIISPEVGDILKGFMREVVREGTGVKARVANVETGGKTGTAQKFDRTQNRYLRGKYVASFIGFAPYDKPRYVVGVFLDEPQKHIYGGDAAGPVFSEVIEKIIHFDYDLPVAPKNKESNLIYAEKVKSIPRLTGAEIRNVVDYLEDKDFDVEVAGKGLFVGGTSVTDDKITIKSLNDKVENEIMPDLKGLTIRQALTLVDFSKLNVEINGNGKIYRQSITPGSKINSKKTVVLSLK